MAKRKKGPTTLAFALGASLMAASGSAFAQGANPNAYIDMNNLADGVWAGWCIGSGNAERVQAVCGSTDNRAPFNKTRPMQLRRELPGTTSSRVILTPPNVPTAAGGSTNQNRAATCVVGYQDAGDGTPYHAFRWTQPSGPQDLGTVDAANNANRFSDAMAVSDDCSVIVGMSQFSATVQHAYRWTAAGGMVDIGAPAGAARSSRAFGVSADGSVVVGEGEFVDAGTFSGFRTGAYRWTAAGGFQSLGALQPLFPTYAFSVSGDGSVIVGAGGVSITVGGSGINGSRAFRWTQATGLVPIGPLAGHQYADAAGVSDNGRIVVGTSSIGPLDHNGVGGVLRGRGTAFRWTQTTGIQDLKQLLVAAGVNMTGISLLTVTGLSPDGQWIVGEATTPTTPVNETIGYIVQYCDADIGAACLQRSSAPVTPSFAMSASVASLSVAAGQSANATLTISPSGGFNAAVSFACTGLPKNANCTFTPASVTPAGGAVTTTLRISTDGGAVSMLSPVFVFAALLPVLPVLARRRRRGGRAGLSTGLWVLVVLLAAGVPAGCGGGDNGGTVAPPATGTPAGTSTVTVTATSGTGASTITQTTTLTLTVTR